MQTVSGKNEAAEPFGLKDCALAAIATGRRAQNLRELRDNLATIHPDSIYYHFWGGLLRPRFDDPEYHNDFALWSLHSLQDAILAERLGIIHPNEFKDLEALRQELIDLIEERLDETEWIPWAKTDQQFYFVRSQLVVFDTRHRFRSPEEMGRAMPRLTVSSVFYHFIDAQRRSPVVMDDFSAWIRKSCRGYEGLLERLGKLDPFFSSLTELRNKLTSIFSECLGL